MIKIIRQEEVSRGTKQNWLNLIKCDEMMKSLTVTSKQSPLDQLQKMNEEKEGWQQHAKRQRKQYAAKRTGIQLRENGVNVKQR